MDSALAHIIEAGEQRTSDVAASSLSFGDLHLHRDILASLRSYRFTTPTKIQAAAIPIALAGMDMLIQSKSGTGKTLIYVLTALQLVERNINMPQVLIVVPTRELAVQVEDTVNGLMSKSYRNQSLCVSSIGGTDVKKNRLLLAKARIVVGTPGRLMHLMQNQTFNTSAIKLIVLDEADQLYATESLQKDVGALIAPILPQSQVIACSATYPNGLDDRLAQSMRKPILVSNSERATVLLGIRQFVYLLPEQVNTMQEMKIKLTALHRLFGLIAFEQCILFANSQSRADSFRNYLQRDKVRCELMSGAMKQSDRLETFQAYRNFQLRLMVATDLMARGVDSAHANLVINLDPPKDLVTYLHRIGRAGRFGSNGIAITFIASPQQDQHFRRIIHEAGTGMSVLQFPVEHCKDIQFWDFDSYNFPYYHKSEASEQDDAQLKDIKQRWKHIPDDKPNMNNKVDKLPIPKHNNIKADEQTLDVAAGSIEFQAPTKSDDVKEHVSEKPCDLNVISISTPESAKDVEESERIESVAQLLELTPSTDIPAAGPNSINTKTYCLVQPTVTTTTTMNPSVTSNTVDDASSIISDSVDHDSDSNASYTSYYTDSDVRIIWSAVCNERERQKRRKRRRRHNTRNIGCPAIVTPKYKKAKSKSIKENINSNASTINEWQDEQNKQRTIKKKFKRKLQKFKKVQQSENIGQQLALYWKQMDSWRLAQKFDNYWALLDSLDNYMPREYSQLRTRNMIMDEFYNAMLKVYYPRKKQPKTKCDLPETDLKNYNRLLMYLKNDSNPIVPKEEALSKLSVHVEHFDIEPVNVAAEDADDNRSNQSVSYDGYVEEGEEEEHTDNESTETENSYPLSSGFDESTESASSGFESSQYCTSSDYIDEYEEEEMDEEEYEDEDDDDSTIENNDTSDESEEQSDEDSSHNVGLNILAQQHSMLSFRRQYEFIASYVNNYMANYGGEH